VTALDVSDGWFPTAGAGPECGVRLSIGGVSAINFDRPMPERSNIR